MADINVERKGPSIWPWIVGLIVLALLVWALLEMFGRDDDATQVPVVGDTVQTTVGPDTTTFGTQPVGADTLGFGQQPGFDTLTVDTLP